mmetsp:Transcript_71424/g.198249  ORF Transcript_71424/g.198249 Transcript_71424/m.198249 type:complete len:231 (-) Transcript_71424:112-804(-)
MAAMRWHFQDGARHGTFQYVRRAQGRHGVVLGGEEHGRGSEAAEGRFHEVHAKKHRTYNVFLPRAAGACHFGPNSLGRLPNLRRASADAEPLHVLRAVQSELQGHRGTHGEADDGRAVRACVFEHSLHVFNEVGNGRGRLCCPALVEGGLKPVEEHHPVERFGPTSPALESRLCREHLYCCRRGLCAAWTETSRAIGAQPTLEALEVEARGVTVRKDTDCLRTALPRANA